MNFSDKSVCEVLKQNEYMLKGGEVENFCKRKCVV